MKTSVKKLFVDFEVLIKKNVYVWHIHGQQTVGEVKDGYNGHYRGRPLHVRSTIIKTLQSSVLLALLFFISIKLFTRTQ